MLHCKAQCFNLFVHPHLFFNIRFSKEMFFKKHICLQRLNIFQYIANYLRNAININVQKPDLTIFPHTMLLYTTAMKEKKKTF